MTPTEEAEILAQLRALGDSEAKHDDSHIRLLWPAFGLQRHLRSEYAWRSARLYWENVDDYGAAKLREVLHLYNEFYREPITGLDLDGWDRITEGMDNDMLHSVEGIEPTPPQNPRWLDSNEDDDNWTLYGEICVALGVTTRADWPALDQMFRKLLARDDCYNDVSRCRLLLGEFLWRSRNEGIRRSRVPDGQHRVSASRMRHLH